MTTYSCFSMITSAKYDLIHFRKPVFLHDGSQIDFLKGLDTEAYDNGEPFLCCFEDGKGLELKLFPSIFFDEGYEGSSFGVYNLKYDAGALIYYLSKNEKYHLWRYQTVKVQGVTIDYIPHKMLSIRKGVKKKDRILFWDVCQFYKMSLDKAAGIYLGKHKKDIETKTFTKTFVEKHFERIREYCVYDALLVSELGNFLIKKLEEFGIRTTSLYSGASLSFRYYADTGRINTAWKYYKNNPDFLKMAIDTYQGGKFEISQRGFFPVCYEYDITSAYPYEIMNLLDLTFAKVERSKRYRKDAVYAYMKVVVHNEEGKYLSVGVKEGVLQVYPAGVFSCHCTKAEYVYMTETLDLQIDIIDAYWLFFDVRLPLYRKRTEKLFALKKQYKNKDAMLYEVTKRMLNGFYGKSVQLIEKREEPDELDITKNPDDLDDKEIDSLLEDNIFYEAGQGFNPCYGAVITANTRLKVTALQNLYGDDCLGVHTDSVLLKRTLDGRYLDGQIGSFEYVDKGELILIACGMYQLSHHCAYRGFQPERVKDEEEVRYESWKEILSRKPESYKIPYPVRKSESWTEAVSKGHYDKINLFYEDIKEIDLNCDRKRIWPKKMRAKEFLCADQKSLPMIVIEK